ncbi:hypothetical protein FB45DRAFT_889181 [Roridomyces roridus]|uniref:RING-type domain-containing protein n=1 Tax=Roridomyces roridus TaxID=1738132 RepID=A0AAD7CK93_9AGAR|nr:hypothetical protein FB45DRAFT_889181 [Roridomyces roridus]
MVESSLSNWDGKATHKSIPTSKKPHMISSPPTVLASPKSGALAQTSRAGKFIQVRDNEPSSADATTHGTNSTCTGPSELHFGAPRHILTDPVSATTPAPAWLRENTLTPSRTQSSPNLWSSTPLEAPLPKEDRHSESQSRKVQASTSLPSLPSAETAKRAFNGIEAVVPSSNSRSAASHLSPVAVQERERVPPLRVYGKPKLPPTAVAGASGTSWWGVDGKQAAASGGMTTGDDGLSEDELQTITKPRADGSRWSGSRSLSGSPQKMLKQRQDMDVDAQTTEVVKPVTIRTYGRNSGRSSASPPEDDPTPLGDPRDLFSPAPPQLAGGPELSTPPHDPNHIFSPPPSPKGVVVRLGRRSGSALSIPDSPVTRGLKRKGDFLDCVLVPPPPLPKRPKPKASLPVEQSFTNPKPTWNHFDYVPGPSPRRWKSPTLTEGVGLYRSPPNRSISPVPPRKASGGKVHLSLDAALNHASANNERGMPVFTPSVGDELTWYRTSEVRGRRDERVKKKRKHSVEPKEQFIVDDSPQRRKRARKVDPDDVDENQLQICWDVSTAELDRLACANIALYFYDTLLVDTTNTESSARTELPRMSLLPPRVEEDEQDISAGGNVRFWGAAVVDSPVKEAKRALVAEKSMLKPNPSTSKLQLAVDDVEETFAPAPRPALAPSSSASEPLGSSVELPPTTSVGLPSAGPNSLLALESPPALSMKARGKQRADRTPTPQREEVANSHQIPWVAQRPVSPQPQSPPPAHQMSDFFNIDASPNQGSMQISPPHPFPLYSTALSATQFVSPASLGHHNPPPDDSLPLFDGQPHYGDGTVDPSLLLGGATETTVETLHEPEEDLLRSPSPTPSAASSSSAAAPAPVPTPVRTSGRTPASRRVPDYLMNTDLLDSDYENDASSGSGSGKATRVAKKVHSKNSKKPASARQPKIRKAEVTETIAPAVVNPDRFHRYSGPPWPLVEDSVFCHQCRRRTDYLNMQFDQCTHAFCVRCIMIKYERGTVPFQLQASTEECPRCSGICTCDVCTRRRGVVYVPVTKTRHPHLEGKLIEPATYYATMYDFNGVAIAQTFLGADGDTTVALAQRMNRRRRVFIGAVQEGWELGAKPRVYIEPSPILAAKEPIPGQERYYVGEQSVLSLPVLPRPVPVALPALPPPVEVVPTVPTSVSEPSPHPLEPTSEPIDMPSPLSSLTDFSDRDDDEFAAADAEVSDPQQPKGPGQLDCTNESPTRAELTQSPLVQALPDSFPEHKNAEVLAH